MEEEEKKNKSWWVKGQSGNPAGKPKGVKNTKTVQWEIFSEFMLSSGLEKFQDEMQKLKPYQYCKLTIELLEFFKPKLSKRDVQVENKSIDKIVIETVYTNKEEQDKRTIEITPNNMELPEHSTEEDIEIDPLTDFIETRIQNNDSTNDSK